MRTILRRRLGRKWSENRNWFAVNGLTLVLLGLFFVIYFSRFGIGLEVFLLDKWRSFRGLVPASKQIVLVTYTEETHLALKVSPLAALPRATFAQFLKKISPFEPRAVVFDILFEGPGFSDADNRKFAESLSLAPTLLGRLASEDEIELITEYELPFAPLRPLPMLEDAAFGTFVTVVQENLGAIRWFAFVRNGDRSEVPFTWFLRELKIEHTQPGKMDFINFYGGESSFRSISLEKVLSSDAATLRELFFNKIVVIGSKETLLSGVRKQDFLNTPLRMTSVPGVVIQATILSNMLEGDWIRRLPLQTELMIFTVAIFLLVLVIFVAPPLYGLGVWILFSGGWLGTSYLLFLNNTFLPGATLCGVILPSALLLSFYRWYRTYRSRNAEFEEAIGLSSGKKRERM